jgi:hypothetical protein
MTAAGRASTAANPKVTAWPATPRVLVTLAILLLVRLPVHVSAQTVEVAPFGGYRFGGDFFELATNRPLDLDGAPAVGAVVNIEMSDGLSFEALFTHQQAHVDISNATDSAPARARAVVEHWLAGGRQDIGTGRARPFVTGLLGLTRYGAAGDDEVRFTIGAGGGVKLLLQRRLGLRLDGRVFTTFVDVDAHAVACGPGTCLVGLNVNVVWQGEFTAGLVFVF